MQRVNECSYVCLSFNETNILMENYRKQDHVGMIARIDNLLQHTSDPHLKHELNSLLVKIQNLTREEYRLLAADIERAAIIFPPCYVLPHVEQDL